MLFIVCHRVRSWDRSSSSHILQTDSIVARHSLLSHFYADDNQLYLSDRHETIPALRSKLIFFISKINVWIASNKLKLNRDSLRCPIKRKQHLYDLSPLPLGGATISPSSVIRDLGILVAGDLSILGHVNQLVSRCFHQLRRIQSYPMLYRQT